MTELNRSCALSEKLTKARPAIEAQGPPTPEDRANGADMKGFPRGTPYGDMIGSQSALFDLDHRWWPKHREAVLKLIDAASSPELTGRLSSPKAWAQLEDALDELTDVKGK